MKGMAMGAATTQVMITDPILARTLWTRRRTERQWRQGGKRLAPTAVQVVVGEGTPRQACARQCTGPAANPTARVAGVIVVIATVRTTRRATWKSGAGKRAMMTRSLALLVAGGEAAVVAGRP